MEPCAKRLIQRGGRSGVVRPTGEKSSAPGEPPKTDTGVLVGSISVSIGKGGMVADVGSDVEYAKYLEFGTTKMAARPWLHPTFKRLKKRITKNVASAMRRSVAKAART